MAFARVALHTKSSNENCKNNTAEKQTTQNAVNDNNDVSINSCNNCIYDGNENNDICTCCIVNEGKACELQKSKINTTYNTTTLDVCAIRAIAKGEELTMDYRTFMDSLMPPFKCFCGCANCAGVIAPDNVLFQFVESDENINKKTQNILKKEKLSESAKELTNQSSCTIHLLNKVEKSDKEQFD